MRALLRSIIEDIRESLGEPMTLLRALEQHPHLRVELPTPAPCIAASSVVRWHELGKPDPFRWPPRKRGDFMGWKGSTRQHYQSYDAHVPEYAQIAKLEIIENWTCDLQQLHGFSNSKSDLRKFTSMDTMVERNSQSMIDEVSHAKLANNLAHREIRILHQDDPSDHFTLYAWDGRIWLMNSGGSHHLAAAKYIAARLGAPVPLRGKLYVYTFNTAAIESLRREFEIFVISVADPAAINAFHDAMRAFLTHWVWHDMPRPYRETHAILLPRSEQRSMRVAEVLRNAGVFDLGAHLENLAATQPREPLLATARSALQAPGTRNATADASAPCNRRLPAGR